MLHHAVSPSCLAVTIAFAACAVLVADAAAQTVPIVSFPTSEDRSGRFRDAPGDATPYGANPPPISGDVLPGQTRVMFDALFSPTSPRNPDYDSTPQPWMTPQFFGGYRLEVTNNTPRDYLPNFVRRVFSPASGPGYASLPVAQVYAFSQDGTVTNTVSGAFVTPTVIADGGVFHVDLPGRPLQGATASFRGVAFDGAQWLVTANSGSMPSDGIGTVDVNTTGGWLALNTVNFSTGAAASLAGPITHSGIWFHASETAQPFYAVFDFTFSNVTYTNPQAAVPDSGSVLALLAIGLCAMWLGGRWHARARPYGGFEVASARGECE